VDLVVIELGKKAVLACEEDLPAVKLLLVAPGDTLLRFSVLERSLHSGTVGQGDGRLILGGSAELRNAVVGGCETRGWQADEVCKVLLIERPFVLRIKVVKVNLGGREFGLRQIDASVDACIETVGDDGDELLGACQLLIERLLARDIAVKREIGDNGVLFNLGTSVVDVEYCSFQTEARGANVVSLGPAKQNALQRGIDDRRLPERVTVGPAEARPDGYRRNVDVLTFFKDRGGLVHVCLREANARIVLEREIHCGNQRDLGMGRLRRRAERDDGENQQCRRVNPNDCGVPLHRDLSSASMRRSACCDGRLVLKRGELLARRSIVRGQIERASEFDLSVRRVALDPEKFSERYVHTEGWSSVGLGARGEVIAQGTLGEPWLAIQFGERGCGVDECGVVGRVESDGAAKSLDSLIALRTA